MSNPSTPPEPRCPSCFRADNVRPLTVGMVGDYPATVEYECSACARVFKPQKPESGFLTKKVTS